MPIYETCTPVTPGSQGRAFIQKRDQGRLDRAHMAPCVLLCCLRACPGRPAILGTLHQLFSWGHREGQDLQNHSMSKAVGASGRCLVQSSSSRDTQNSRQTHLPRLRNTGAGVPAVTPLEHGCCLHLGKCPLMPAGGLGSSSFSHPAAAPRCLLSSGLLLLSHLARKQDLWHSASAVDWL